MTCHVTAGILISSGSQPTIRHNRVFSGQAAGIEVTNGGGGFIHDNEVFKNKFDGICLATGVSPDLSGECSHIETGIKYIFIIGKLIFESCVKVFGHFVAINMYL